MRVYSLALFKKTKANKANESLFVCARRIIMAELPNNEKEGEEAKNETPKNEAPKDEVSNAKKIAHVRSVQTLLPRNSEKKNAKSVLSKLVAVEIATVAICGF